MIPIFKPFMPEDIMIGIQEVLYSGQLAYGKYGKEFENSLINYIGNDKLITTSSYNHALLIVLSVLDLKPGDEIIASPVSCLASNQPFAVRGLKVKWVDIDPVTGTIDVSNLRSILSTKTKAIFNNFYCGYAGELDDVYAIGKEFGIPVIDDCIEAFGTTYKGRKTGNTNADISVFSFQTVRLPNTIDGGAITFKDKQLYEKAILSRDYGINRTNFRLPNGEINPNCDIAIEGFGATMSEVNSYVGLKQMEVIAALIKKQIDNAVFWNDYFKNYKDVMPLIINQNVNPNYWVYGVLANDKETFIKEMRTKGFYATGVHINNNIYSVFKNDASLKGVNEFMMKYVAIPCGWWFQHGK